MRVLSLILAGALACSACAQAPVSPVDFSTSCSRLGERGSAAVRWYRTSAESRALFLQAFRLASDRLAQLARGRVPGTWAVVADSDETLLDTSEFQCELEASRDGKFDPVLWDRWVATSRATGTPGAADFVRLVRSLGGRLIVVSNA